MIDTPFTAVIVEPRKHSCLEYVLNNFNEGLDNRWQFLIIHGNDNKEFVKNIVDKLTTRKITLKNINVGNYSIEEYNLLFYDKNFYDLIPTEIFLVFQTDTLVCLKNKHLINEFLQYDYVGAPWAHYVGVPRDDKRVGNGGLSLRRKTKMLEILEKGKHLKLQPNGTHWCEDVFFSLISKNIPDLFLYRPDFEKAKKFAVETVFHNESFGTHKGWAFTKSESELLQYKNSFPEVTELLKISKN